MHFAILALIQCACFPAGTCGLFSLILRFAAGARCRWSMGMIGWNIFTTVRVATGSGPRRCLRARPGTASRKIPPVAVSGRCTAHDRSQYVGKRCYPVEGAASEFFVNAGDKVASIKPESKGSAIT
jgi:hypothetical protein